MRCTRPQVRCICALVPKVHNRTPVWVLQHPRERCHPFGTVPLLRLALGQLEVEVCWQVTASARAQRVLAEAAAPSAASAAQAASQGPAPTLGLLFPSSQAVELSTLAPVLRPRRLLVLDGTWSTVQGLLRQNPVLARLPHYSIAPDRTDRYQIRREPKAHYTSTLEATVAALRALEPSNEAALENLLTAFSAMIEGQLALRQGRHVVRRRIRHRSEVCA